MSILTRIAVLFLTAFFLVALVTFGFTHHIMMNYAELQGEMVAKAAATAAMTEIDSKESLAALYEDEEFRDNTHDDFRYICQKTGLRYLYLYTVGEGNKDRHYIICAANSEEDDIRVQDDYGFGKVQKTELYPSEISVLNRDKDGDYHLTDNEYGFVCSYIVPVTDSDNKIIALIGADYSMERIGSIAVRSLKTLLILGAILILPSYIIALFLIRRSVIRPIRALSERMRSFARDKKECARADRRKTVYEDEVTDIENSFDEMTTDISQYVQDIEELTSEKVFNQTQLDVATKIQSGIVPLNCFLSGDRFEVYGCSHPARDVGGDFYDMFRLDNGQICAVVGDISGKGISAALFMVMVKSIIREVLIAGRSLDDALNLLNREIYISNPENMFATVFAMTLQPETGIVTFANAGHEEPLLLGENPSYLKVNSGIALGLFEDSDIVSETITLKDGEGILLYTDGITEAIDEDKKQYGKERLREAVMHEYQEDICSFDSLSLVEDTTAEVRAFAGKLEQFDDITCLALVYKGTEGGKRNLTPDIESFDSVKKTILSALGDSEHTKNVILACEEIFSNIVNYSGADQVFFFCRNSGETWSATFADNGIAFDPVTEKQKSRQFEDLDHGGMGIALARLNSKEMIYRRVDENNLLTLVFDKV